MKRLDIRHMRANFVLLRKEKLEELNDVCSEIDKEYYRPEIDTFVLAWTN